jgi:ADP-ribose pyrophosphatase
MHRVWGFRQRTCSGWQRTGRVAQPREAVEEDELLEMPAGTLDRQEEDELECARREPAEEPELQAEHWSLLRVIYPSPGFLTEKVSIFEAADLSPATRTLATTMRRSR